MEFSKNRLTDGNAAKNAMKISFFQSSFFESAIKSEFLRSIYSTNSAFDLFFSNTVFFNTSLFAWIQIEKLFQFRVVWVNFLGKLHVIDFLNGRRISN